MQPDSREAVPSVWLAYAQADLEVARAVEGSDALQRGIGCFHCQQAAEKAIKGVLVRSDADFPYTHDISTLIELLPDDVPSEVGAAEVLTVHAVTSRYPDAFGEVSRDELDVALAHADRVVGWAAEIIAGP